MNETMFAPIVISVVTVCGLFWVAFRRPRPRRWWLPRPAHSRTVSSRNPIAIDAAVDRQHRHVHAGGTIGGASFSSTRTQFEEMLATGRSAEVEEALRPGLDFAVGIKALTAVGTPEAGALLQRLLGRDLSEHFEEQAWYWVDIVAGLRQLNHTSALPDVLNHAERASDLLQGVVLSAEAVSFPNFPAMLHDVASPRARLAIRTLTRVARGCRNGTVDAAAMVRAGLGDHLAAVSESAPPSADSWLIDAVIEAERLSRWMPQWARLIAPDARPLATRQGARLDAAGERRCEWLSGAAARLIEVFPASTTEERTASFRTLHELHADMADLFAGLPDRRMPWWSEAIMSLTWAKASWPGPKLAALAATLTGSRRDAISLTVVLSALRGHRCREAEAVLMKNAAANESAIRGAALGAIGWWDPFDTNNLIPLLRRSRRDGDAATRGAAVAALARLGERAALLEFTEMLASEESAIRQAGAFAIANEGLFWLWPDVQELAETADSETALIATEALERLREQSLGLLG